MNGGKWSLERYEGKERGRKKDKGKGKNGGGEGKEGKQREEKGREGEKRKGKRIDSKGREVRHIFHWRGKKFKKFMTMLLYFLVN